MRTTVRCDSNSTERQGKSGCAVDDTDLDDEERCVVVVDDGEEEGMDAEHGSEHGL